MINLAPSIHLLERVQKSTRMGYHGSSEVPFLPDGGFVGT